MPTREQLPGIDAVGKGFNPFESDNNNFKRSLLKFDFTGDEKNYEGPDSAGTYSTPDQAYTVPKGILINPGGPKLSETSDTFESRSQVEEAFAAKASVSGGFGLFSASVNASYNVNSKSTQDHFFSSKSSTVTLWSLSLAIDLIQLRDAVSPDFVQATSTLPSGHDTSDERTQWDKFFDTYGTHFIQSCRVGGEATLSVTVQKVSGMTSQSIEADVSIEYGSYFSGKGSASKEKTTANYRSNKHINKTFEGGDVTMQSKLEDDSGAMAEWATTISQNPASRDYGMRPIWDLFSDQVKAKAAEAAFLDYCYRNSQYCVKFNDHDANVDISTQRGFSGFEENMCVEAWIYPTGNGTGGNSGGIIVNKEHSFELARFADGTLRYAIETEGDSGWAWRNTEAQIPLDAWTHVALKVWKAQSKDEYWADVIVNGNKVHRRGISGPIKSNLNKLTIGERAFLKQGFQGFMQEVRIWNRLRSLTEIQEDMYWRLTGNEPGLVGLWTLNDARSNDARDLSQNNNIGKLNKAVWGVPPNVSPLTAKMTSEALVDDDVKAVLAAIAAPSEQGHLA